MQAEVRVEGYPDDDAARSAALAPVPFDDLLGITWDLVSPDRVEAHLEVTPGLHQPSGVVHGAVYCALVEAVGSTGSLALVADEGRAALGVHNATSFLRPTRAGRLTAVGVPVHVGRTQHLWEVEVRRDDGRLAARGQLRTQVVDAAG